MNNNSDNEFVNINDFANSKKESSNLSYSNLSDVVKEDYFNNDLDKNKYLYQPQLKDNSCELKIVGYNEKDVKPTVKIGEFNFSNDKWIIISHLYNLNEINNLDKNSYLDIISLVLNKKNFDMVISLRYYIIDKISLEKSNGKFEIVFKYKKLEKQELIKLRDLDKFPNKTIEFLVKELSNPIIIDRYE